MSTEAMRKSFEATDWPLYKDTYNPPIYDTMECPILGTLYVNKDVANRFGTFILGWQAAQANQEAIVKATIEAAANRILHAWGQAAAASIRNLDVQQILESVK